MIAIYFINIWLLMQPAILQTYRNQTLLLADSLDPIPNWEYISLDSAISNTLAQHPDIRTLLPHPRRNGKFSDQGVGIEWNAKVEVDSTILNWPLRTYLLSWVREWIPCNQFGKLDTNADDRLLNNRLLIWAEIQNPQTNKSLWALMVYRMDPKLPNRWEPSFQDLGGRPRYPFSPIKIFSQQPRNIDVYQFVDSLKIIGQRPEFDFRYNIDDCGDLLCSCAKFEDGDVRENTWKKIIGEYPTRFFPNGR